MGSEAASGLRKGAWTEPEDNLLRKCMEKYGEGKWNLVPLRAGLNRCRKSCRLRWLNYLRPNIKRGNFNPDEVDLIIRLHKLLGNRWSLIAGRLPGRTANDVKNYFNTHLLKKLAADRSDVRRSEPMTKTTIIRPQPRTLSRSSTWVKERPNSTSVLTNHNPNPAPSPTLEPAVDGSVEWLNNLTVEDEIMEQVITWPKNGLWPEETWSATKTYDDSCTREDPIGSSDVFSEELWDILKSPDDQVVM